MDHQQFAQLLGNYGEFVGAIAVVVTLGYLAIQIKQNREAESTDHAEQRGDLLDVQVLVLPRRLME